MFDKSPRRSAVGGLAVTDVRTLGEIADRAQMLQVACWRCDRRGRYRLDAPIRRHSADAPVRVIVPELTADCPQRESHALMERCDILELSARRGGAGVRSE